MYSIRKDEYGFASAIERDGYTVLQLQAGTERNEQEASNIVQILNSKEATMINKLQTLQRNVYIAYARKIEVETRDRGWNEKDHDEAEKEYKEAVNAYESAFDMTPEFQNQSDIMGFRYPLYNASTERLMEISVCE